ncbi:hypothetical protein [Coraliomargarita parva]|uniref:hypothetical protein n=1 Tax=Coraliomargarita parva TaxID=3014050 RepID=UPI0022B49CCF|nr:hypothetical protein [Coraliomargarita parva]
MTQISAPKDLNDKQPIEVPYLQNIPDVIDLQPGRQLFLDDFLWEAHQTSMSPCYHRPEKYTGNPILWPASPEETNPQFPSCAIAKSGGVWFDDRNQLFKMWYMTGYLGYAALATSKDGIHWERPKLDVVPNTNLILPKDIHPDSGSVIIDHEAAGDEPRYKMLMREPNPVGPPWIDNFEARLYTSHDGVHWDYVGKSGPMDDRSTMYYNPLRRKWVQSIRKWHKQACRARYYHEGDSFMESAQWTQETMTPWMRADCYDHGKYFPAQLYNFDAIAYESMMIGFHQILHGPNNPHGEKRGEPKLTELYLSSSRDGYHWHRPDRTAFIPARREYGSWEYGYIESSAGMCCIVGDELWLYYSAYGGDPDRITKDWRTNGMYANGAMGLAKIRRDGFVSMRPNCPDGFLRTRRLRFNGHKLFVNANTVGSRLSVEILDSSDKAIPGLTHEDCIGFTGNSTCAEIQWKQKDLSGLEKNGVRLHFKMERGDLYSFWMTDSAEGKSGGFTAAGGPAYSGGRDR